MINRVSIRAPVLRPGRHCLDCHIITAKEVSIRAPVLRPGRLRSRRQSEGFEPVSIRAPVLRPGRLAGSRLYIHDAKVSIRAPVLRPGRLHGDARQNLNPSCFNPRPGPSTGATHLVHRPALADLFQSAPRSFDRGDHRTSTGGRGRACFNPRPGPSTGATCMLPGLLGPDFVSIRAPVLRPGRLQGSGEVTAHEQVSIRAPVLRPGRLDLVERWATLHKFQSAPRSFDRGDLTPKQKGIICMLFQSAPRSFDRGDCRP